MNKESGAMQGINPSAANKKPKSTARAASAKRAHSLMQTKRSRFRILPITMTMLGLLLVLKLNSIYFDTIELRETLVASAVAEEPKKEDAKEKNDKKEDDKKEKAEPGGSDISPTEVKALKKLKEQTKYNQIELDLLQNLSQRRDTLDAREKELVVKEKTLEATEQRIASRIDEMKKLQVEVKGLIETYKTHQDSDVKSLVKIYENMKPIDAATIFNELDMTILLSVIDAMSERKVAPILAAMDPKRAKDVTEELAEMRKVKALPDASRAVVAP
jgi:flagellar motility protein MotE (MotC chaperone)